MVGYTIFWKVYPLKIDLLKAFVKGLSPHHVPSRPISCFFFLRTCLVRHVLSVPTRPTVFIAGQKSCPNFDRYFTRVLRSWLVVWLPFLAFSQKYWVSNHPNGRTHIFQRGGYTTTNQEGVLLTSLQRRTIAPGVGPKSCPSSACHRPRHGRAATAGLESSAAWSYKVVVPPSLASWF